MMSSRRAACAFAVVLLVVAACSAQKIKNVVVVMEENRSFDHLLGWRGKGSPKLTGKEYNLVDPSNPNSEKIYVAPSAPQIAPCDPDHSLGPTTIKIFGYEAYKSGNLTDPSMCGFVEFEKYRHEAKTNYCQVMEGLAPHHLPVMNALADNFVLMDNFFASVPGPTWPNRLFFLSATSMGLTETSNPWFLGETGRLFPQPTIFDQIKQAGLTWKNAVNDTPWELMMESIAKHPENVVLMDDFYRDAREGTLPAFTFINPRAGLNLTSGLGSNDMHPDHDVALGEAFYKDIYEAVRASPQWNETLLILTFDEHGGFWDHVPPPMHVPPPGDNTPSYPDKFDFARGGIRIPTILISPWLPKGHVESKPPPHAKPQNNSEYELTSIMATVRKLLGIDHLGPLTKRDAWAATFDHLFNLTEPRTDCPMHLPDALPPTLSIHAEAEQPLNSLQEHIATVHAHMAGVPFPHHIKKQRDISPWLQRTYRRHAKRTAHWKSEKQAPQLAVRCSPLIGMAPSFLSSNWTVSMNQSFPFRILSTKVTLPEINATIEYCLDSLNGTIGTTVTVTPCQPSAHPAYNRDPAQQWLFTSSADIRPRFAPDLCVTNYCINNDDLSTSVTLEKCDGSLAQRYGYMGPAPGNEQYEEGLLAEGSAIYTLVVDYASSQ